MNSARRGRTQFTLTIRIQPPLSSPQLNPSQHLQTLYAEHKPPHSPPRRSSPTTPPNAMRVPFPISHNSPPRLSAARFFKSRTHSPHNPHQKRRNSSRVSATNPHTMRRVDWTGSAVGPNGSGLLGGNFGSFLFLRRCRWWQGYCIVLYCCGVRYCISRVLCCDATQPPTLRPTPRSIQSAVAEE